ncbi:MAG: TnpV protein [Bacteroides pyogenes]|uniref:TnpV protein n=1 Tax=Bacteroides pyogenes TaxID=310300 RepID=UPI002A9153D8|nr:TnpV protein [Bacteroides pyogenes]MDY5354611.1 TnpV protein [Bacteroides pyogenes]MDY5473646.1 TnpV protein [Holdemanella porci]
MEKYKYDESNGLWYELQGDYYLPCLQLPEEEPVHIGVWGQRHLNYLRENKRVLLSNLQISGKLNIYLADIDKQAEEMCSRLVKQMADREDITEQLKAENQMEWVRQMNNIRIRANEIVLRKLIYNS